MSSLSPMDMVWRDHRAREQLGSIVTHTSAVFRTRDDNVIGQGWLYIGKDALIWICDHPIWGNTNEDRIVEGTYEASGWSTRMKRHRISRTATVWMGAGSSFVGGIKQVETLYQLARPPRTYRVP